MVLEDLDSNRKKFYRISEPLERDVCGESVGSGF